VAGGGVGQEHAQDAFQGPGELHEMQPTHVAYICRGLTPVTRLMMQER